MGDIEEFEMEDDDDFDCSYALDENGRDLDERDSEDLSV